MRILLTNDDGIRAPGIRALHREAEKLGETRVIAPLTVQSATSHGMTFHKPITIHDINLDNQYNGIAVDGRPADCVKLAITRLWEDRFGGKPDLVLSGINAGMNAGIHILYSGTVAAAIEGAFLGIPAIAISLHYDNFDNINWEYAAKQAACAIKKILATNLLQPHSMMNVNIPLAETPTDNLTDTPLENNMPPIAVVPMNLSAIRDKYDRVDDDNKQESFRIMGDGLDFDHTSAGSDVEAIFQNMITITPLHYDLTDYAQLSKWKDQLGGITHS